MFMKIVLVVCLIGMAILLYYALKERGKMLADGTIISRNSKFMENAEEFTLAPVEPDKVTEAVRAFNYTNMRTQMQYNAEKQFFKFTGSYWAAQLYRSDVSDEKVTYRFAFTNWKTKNGSAQDDINMNKLLTAVEKMFLNFDSDTKVTTVPLDIKTKHNIF